MENLSKSLLGPLKIDFKNLKSTFLYEKKNWRKKWGIASIPNFPKIPKIALRKLCDEAYCLQAKKFIFLYTNSGILNEFPGCTLK